MSRTIAVFMAMTPLAVAHLLAPSVNTDRLTSPAAAAELARGGQDDSEAHGLPAGAPVAARSAPRHA